MVLRCIVILQPPIYRGTKASLLMKQTPGSYKLFNNQWLKCSLCVIYRGQRKTLKAQCMKLIECWSVWSFNVSEFWPCSSDCTYVWSSHIIFKDTTNQSHINNAYVAQLLSCFIFTAHRMCCGSRCSVLCVSAKSSPNVIFLFACTLLCLFCFLPPLT